MTDYLIAGLIFALWVVIIACAGAVLTILALVIADFIHRTTRRR